MPTFSIEIDRPCEEAFAYVTDLSHFAEWQSGIISGHSDSGGPHHVGSKCYMTRRIGLAEREITSEVTHVEPPRTWGVRGIDGPIRALVDVTVQALDERRSQVTIEIEFAGHGIGRLLVPLFVRPQARREMLANLKRLKNRLESDGSTDPRARSQGDQNPG